MAGSSTVNVQQQQQIQYLQHQQPEHQQQHHQEFICGHEGVQDEHYRGRDGMPSPKDMANRPSLPMQSAAGQFSATANAPAFSAASAMSSYRAATSTTLAGPAATSGRLIHGKRMVTATARSSQATPTRTSAAAPPPPPPTASGSKSRAEEWQGW